MTKEEEKDINRMKKILKQMIALNDEAWAIKIKYEGNKGTNNCFVEICRSLETTDAYLEAEFGTLQDMIKRIERIIRERAEIREAQSCKSCKYRQVEMYETKCKLHVCKTEDYNICDYYEKA